MDENEKRRAYSEIVEILKLIEDEEKLEKIPFEIIEMIKNNSDPTYKPIISKDIPLEEQNLSKTTLGILEWISKKFWDDDEHDDNDKFNNSNGNKDNDENAKIDEEDSQEKQDEQDHQEENSDETQEEDNGEEKISAIVYNDLDEETLDMTEKMAENSNLPIAVHSLKFYEKMIIRVVHFLRKIFKANYKNLKEGANE